MLPSLPQDRLFPLSLKMASFIFIIILYHCLLRVLDASLAPQHPPRRLRRKEEQKEAQITTIYLALCNSNALPKPSSNWEQVSEAGIVIVIFLQTRTLRLKDFIDCSVIK